MAKKILVLLAVLLIFTGLSAQINQFPLKVAAGEKPLKFASETKNVHQLKVSMDNLKWTSKKVKTGEVFTELWFDKSNFVGEVGTPQLPAYKKLIILPYGASATATVKSYTQAEYSLSEMGIKNSLMPVQPSIRKDQDSTSIPFQYRKEAYAKQSYSNNSMVTLEVLGNMRSYTIARIVVTPVDYNPNAETIKVFNDLDIEIKVTEGTKSTADLQSISSPYFDILTQLALNTTESVYDEHPELTKYPIKMLIISNRMFETSLAPFIAWKKQKGISVTAAYTDVIGTTTAQIKSYIQQQYNSATATDPAPTFLVFVGDVAQVPSSATGTQSQKQTDLYYASIDGDIFPEMYYGRLSATTTTQLDNIISKILYYEKYEFANPEYLNSVTLIAGADGTYNSAIGQPTIKYGTANYFNSATGFTTVNEYGVSNDPSNSNEQSSYTGCYDAEKVAVGFINYTAHCSETTWGDPELTISEVNAFNNQAKYPLAVANCCLSGDFGTSECVGEAWIRAQNKGAVTYVGSSPSSYWQEDMYWSVGAFPMSGINNGYVPTFAETTTGAYDAAFGNVYRTVGAMVFAGNLAVTEANSLNYPVAVTPTYYWEAYNILGDPSLMPYFTSATANTVTHEESIYVGLNAISVSALEGSYVSITKDFEILGTSYFAETGKKSISLQPVENVCSLLITVTRPQTIPYIGIVEAINATDPYVILKSTSVNDSEGNNNGLVDFGETIKASLTVKNIGAVASTNTRVLLTSHTGFVTLTSSDSVYIGTIQAGTENNPVTINDAFTFDISPNVPHSSTETFTLTFKSDQGTWTSVLSFQINAPKIDFGKLVIDDSVLGNNNGTANVGESFHGKVTISNTGGSNIADLAANFSIPDSVSDLVTLNYELFENIDMDPEDAYTLNFRMSVSPGIVSVQTIPVVVTVSSAANTFVDDTIVLYIEVLPDNLITMANKTVSTCYAVFTDSGGDGANYTNGESFVTTITSTSEIGRLKVSFTEFDVESGYDKLYVYNGSSTSAEQVAGSPFSGNTIPSDIIASDKSLTFKFTSDSGDSKAGWVATVVCVEPTQVPSCVTSPSPANGATGVLPFVLSWVGSTDAQFYDVYIGYDLDNLALLKRVYGSDADVDLERNKTYYWKVIPGNYIGSCTDACNVWNFQTGTIGDVLMTNGSITTDSTWFYDSGYSSGNYQNGEDYVLTFSPKYSGAKLSVSFAQFAVETNTSCSYDYLNIYNGPTTSSTLVGKYCGTALPNSYTSTSTNGELTFKFHSDQDQTGIGWKAKITSVGAPTLYTLTVVVKSGGALVGNASVCVNGAVMVTGANGEAQFSIPAGTYSYTVNATGCFESTGTITNSGANQSITVELSKNYSSTIKVFDDATGNPVQGAAISVNGNIFFTSSAGVATIYSGIGTYSLTIEKNGFTSVTSDINVVGEGGNFNFTLKPGVHSISVVVKDVGGNLLPLATVMANGITKTTDAAGKATLELPYGIYKVLVSKEKYLSAEQFISVTADSQVSVLLDFLQTEISFTIYGSGPLGVNALADATVSIYTGTDVAAAITSNSLGNAKAQLAEGVYKYVIAKEGYRSYTVEALSVGTSDVELKDTLDQITYTITVAVKSGESAVTGADVVLNGYSSQQTDAQGFAVFNTVGYAKGLTYTVKKDGYNDFDGSGDIDSDKTITVNLTAVGIDNVETSVPKIYPNPTTDRVTVDAVQPMELVQIISITGSLVMEIRPNGLSAAQVPFSAFDKGTYIVRIVYTNGYVYHAKLIKL